MLGYAVVVLCVSFLLYRVHVVLSPQVSVNNLELVPADCTFVDIFADSGGRFPVGGTEDYEVVNDRYMITSNL
jgi:hypothetical protein